MSKHDHEHQAAARRSLLQPAQADVIKIGSRRWMLQAGLAGVAGLSTAEILRQQALAATAPGTGNSRKAVIILWLSGGPTHLDTWDPKPEAPIEERGPFTSISTAIPGVRVCEHLPLQASIMDRMAILRGVDCRASEGHNSSVMQSGHSQTFKELKLTGIRWVAPYPSMGSVVARYRGANDSALPAFVGMGDPSDALYYSDIYGSGHLGPKWEPIRDTDLSGRLNLPQGINVSRLQDRADLRRQFDRFRSDLDASQMMTRMDQYGQQAVEMVVSGKARQAMDIAQESDKLRDRYGRDSFGEKALLARRLVEAGVTFIVISARFGVFDVHGDDVIWGGLIKGMKPLYPSIDRSMYALVTDLESRGLLDDTLILMMGEFGRSPQIAPTGGRTHWTNCMSVLAAGGGATHGQIIGSTDARGYDVKDGRIIPADIAATIYRHLEIDPHQQWQDHQGRPHPIIADGGQPIAGLA